MARRLGRSGPVDNLAFVVAGYSLTAAALLAYVAGLSLRARRAKLRTAAIIAKRRT